MDSNTSDKERQEKSSQGEATESMVGRLLPDKGKTCEGGGES